MTSIDTLNNSIKLKQEKRERKEGERERKEERDREEEGKEGRKKEEYFYLDTSQRNCQIIKTNRYRNQYSK